MRSSRRSSAARPYWAAPITGVPVGKIEEAATLYGQGPSLLWLGQGLQRQPTGGNIFRAVGCCRRQPATLPSRAPASSI